MALAPRKGLQIRLFRMAGYSETSRDSFCIFIEKRRGATEVAPRRQLNGSVRRPATVPFHLNRGCPSKFRPGLTTARSGERCCRWMELGPLIMVPIKKWESECHSVHRSNKRQLPFAEWCEMHDQKP
jgi:hypothetical protein